jgi:hypothetical protein
MRPSVHTGGLKSFVDDEWQYEIDRTAAVVRRFNRRETPACHPSCGTSAKLGLAPVAHLSVPLGRMTSNKDVPIIPATTL